MVWRAPSDVGPLPPGLDLEHCRWALSLLTDPAAWVGLRGLVPGGKGARNLILPAADVDGLLRQAEQWQRQGLNVYLNLNPVAPGTARPANLGPLVEHVARRRWLFVDIDPVRAAGHEKDSATEEEKGRCRELAHRVRAHLGGQGWPAPVFVDSGNGFYLLYRIDLPNDDENRELVKGVLARIGKEFSCADGHIDTACYDAPRIAKLAGTLARKGPHTAERPHRPCRLLEVPETLEVLGEAELVEFVGVQSQDAGANAGARGNGTTNGAGPGWHAPGGKGGGADVEIRAIAYLADVPGAIDGNGGSDVTFWAARALVWGFCLDQGTAYRLLDQHYNPRCHGPWTEKELRHKVEDAGKGPFSKPYGWLLREDTPRYRAEEFGAAGAQASGSGSGPNGKAKATPKAKPTMPEPYRPFPVDALPEPVASFVGEGSVALGCDAAYLALPALAVCAGAIGNSRALRLKRNWTEPCALWTVIVGESGTLKTPAWRLAVGPMHAAGRVFLDVYRNEAKRWNEQDKQGEGPTLRRVICSDVTVEKLAEILEDNPRGVLVSRDEMAGWLGSFKRYKSQGGTDLPNWLELHQAGTISIDRKTGERRHVLVDHALVSLTGGIQPRTLARSLADEHFDAGLVARLLLAWPDRLPKAWNENEVSELVQDRYTQLVDRLLGLDMMTGRDGKGKMPNRLLLSPEAKALWVEFYDEWAQEQAAAEGELAALFSKLEGCTARLALLHHVVWMVGLETSDERPVGVVSVESAITLVRWFAAEARRIYATLGEGDGLRDTRRLLAWIRARGSRVTARELQNSNSRRYPNAEAAEAALEALAQAGMGEWVPVAPGPHGGRPTRVFVLVTDIPTTDTTSHEAGESSGSAPDDTPS